MMDENVRIMSGTKFAQNWKIYHDALSLMRAELMPWDTHLNSDVHASLDCHCLVSKQLKDDDPKKFDASTPKRMLRAYRRILHPTNKGVCPTSRQILQDVRRIILALHMIRAADGMCAGSA